MDDDMDIGPAPWPEHTQHYQQQRPPGAGGEGTAAAPSPFSYSTTSSSSPDQNNAFSKPTTSSAAGAGAGADAAIPPPRNTTNTRRRQPLLSRFRALFHPVHGKLRPFRLLREDAAAVRARWVSDWTVMNQLVLASAVYVFFTNILPGITFASDLYVLTGQSWGTIEVVFSTGLCGLIFSLLAAQPLCILGVTGPFTVLAENMYKLCTETFDVSVFFFFFFCFLVEVGTEFMHDLTDKLPRRFPSSPSWPGPSCTPHGCTSSSPCSTPTTGRWST